MAELNLDKACMVKTLISIILLFFIAINIHIPEYYSEDMVIHVPLIKKVLNTSLYPGDLLVEIPNPQKNSTVYYSFVANSTSISPFSFEFDLKLLYMVYVFLYISILLALARMLVPSSVAVLFVLLVITKFPIGGSGVSTIESEIVPRSLGTLGSLVGIYFLVNKKLFSSVLTGVVALLFHPLSVFYALWILVGQKLLEIKYSKKRLYVAFICLGVGFFILYISGKIVPIDESWLHIIKFRNPYAFLNLWSMLSWMYFGVLLVPGILYLIVSNHTPSDKLTVLIRGTYISAIILTLVHLFFVLYMPVHEVILLQIGRIWYYPILLSLLASSILFTRLVRSKAIQIALVLIFFLSIHGYRMMARPAFSDGQWLDVQYWAQKNTSIYCSFLVPFSSRGFRSVSERTITGDYKDGALSFYSQDFASEWKHRRDELAQWQKMNENEIQLLEKKYNFDYIVEEIENKKRLPIVYQNSKYIVYDMQGDSQCN